MAMKEKQQVDDAGIADDAADSPDGGYGADDDSPYYTGDTGELAAIYENAGFNALKELMNFDQSLDNILPKGNFTPERANLLRRMAMKEMVAQNGSLNREDLIKLETMLSVAVDGEHTNKIVRILSGMGEVFSNAARGGVDRMKDWGRKF